MPWVEYLQEVIIIPTLQINKGKLSIVGFLWSERVVEDPNLDPTLLPVIFLLHNVVWQLKINFPLLYSQERIGTACHFGKRNAEESLWGKESMFSDDLPVTFVSETWPDGPPCLLRVPHSLMSLDHLSVSKNKVSVLHSIRQSQQQR